MAPKKKQAPMSLSELSQLLSKSEISGSSNSAWAEEECDLPSAPLSMLETDERLPASSLSSMERPNFERRERERRQQAIPTPTTIDHQRLPTRPPFIAFVANLSYDTTEGDLRGYFKNLQIKSIKVPLNREDNRPKGYAYVEFDSLDDLTKSLLMMGPGFQLNNRYPRIDISDAKQKEGFGGSSSSFRGIGMDRPIERRTEPLPAFEKRQQLQSPSSSFGPMTNWREVSKPITPDQVQQQQPIRDRAEFKPGPSHPVKVIAEEPKKPDLKSKLKPLSAVQRQTTKDDRNKLADVYVQKGKENPFGLARPKEIKTSASDDGGATDTTMTSSALSSSDISKDATATATNKHDNDDSGIVNGRQQE